MQHIGKNQHKITLHEIHKMSKNTTGTFYTNKIKYTYVKT
jgi:hypothetical protein